jgi:hypothetical protein
VATFEDTASRSSQHRSDGQLDRVQLAEVGSQVDGCDPACLGVSYLDAGEGLGSSSDSDIQPVCPVRPANGVHGLSELLPVPSVGEEIDVLAQPVHELMCLKCVATGEYEPV